MASNQSKKAVGPIRKYCVWYTNPYGGGNCELMAHSEVEAAEEFWELARRHYIASQLSIKLVEEMHD